MLGVSSSSLIGVFLLVSVGQQTQTVGPAVLAERLAAAEAAHRTGDEATALRLYAEILDKDPENQDALKRSSRILKATGKLPEAVARYERLAAVRPLAREETLELANWLLENQQGRKALALISPLLEQDPSDARAQLVEAHALYALRQMKAARAVAHDVLGADPASFDALNLIAQTYHWGGRPEFAREWYERAVAISPESFTARFGLTALDIRPDPGAARRSVDTMLRQRGRDRWTESLDRALAGDSRPVVSSGYTQRESEKDQLEAYFAQARWNLARSREFEVTATQTQGRFGPPGSPSGTMNTLYAAFGGAVRSRQRLSVKAGLGNRTDSLGNSQLRPYGGATWQWGVGERLSGSLGAAVDPYTLTLSSVQESVDLAGLTGEVQRKFVSGLRVQARAVAAKLLVTGEQGTNRWGGGITVGQEWQLRGVFPVTLDYTFDHFEHSQQIESPGGFFAPLAFTGHSVGAGFKAAIPARLDGRRLDLSLTGRYTRMTYDGANDGSLNGALLMSFHLGNGLEFIGTLARSNSSVTMGWPGSNSTQIGFGLRFTPIRR